MGHLRQLSLAAACAIEGGVALAGLELERVGRPPGPVPGAGGLRERLRALGYLAE